MKISFIFPSKNRPHKCISGIENIRGLSVSDDYEIICAFDEDDPTTNNDHFKSQIQQQEKVKSFYGISHSKIAACNREIHNISPDTSIICLFSDDMVFLNYGFDKEIRKAFNEHFPCLDGIIHFPDGHTGNRTMTLTLMGINLFKQLGYLYWPEYFSVYADNDLTEMCRLMGKYKFVDKNIFIHNHPIWGGGVQWDDQYRKWESQLYYKKDGETFKKRKESNFGL